MTRRTIWARSIGLGILAAVVYGVVHDQVTVRISPPYLMDWHPQIVPSREPTVVALAWGVVATWWFGLILGVVLAAAATLGKRPPAPWTWIVRAVRGIFVCAALAAIAAGLIVRGLRLELPDVLFNQWYTTASRPTRIAFSQAAAMHEASYDAAGVTTLVAAILVFRGRKTTPETFPQNDAS